MKNPFRERLSSGPVIVTDGAMGTQLYARGVAYDQCFDAQNLDRPDLVEQIHRDYINAGAELIETNTFGGNRIRLGAFGLEDSVREINRTGVRLARAAREICGEPVFVAGSIGPTGRALEPYGNLSTAEIYDVFHEQALALLEGGVDLFILETFSDIREIEEAIRAVRAVGDLPIVAEMTFAEDLSTPTGQSIEQVAESLGRLPVDAIGANCSVGSNSLLAVTEKLVTQTDKPVSAMPNAGWPMQVGNRFIYLSSPEYMAEYGRRMAELGAALVGGCCGTTPAHIQVLRRKIAELIAEKQGGESPAPRSQTLPALRPLQTEESGEESGRPSRLRSLAEQGSLEDASELTGKLGRKRVISVEIRPPRGSNPGKALQGARLLRDAGVDALNVLDSAMSRVRMSSVATSVLIKSRLGVEPILHFTTRDRNLMAIQSDLIGAHALGIRTVLALTGDPPSMGDYAQSKAVYDVDSIGLIRIVKRLNEGEDVGGNSIGTPTRFLVGCALNPTADDLGWELDRFRQKLEAGADFVMTQPVYDADLFRGVLHSVGPLDVPILMGVLPLQSFRHALFLHNELPGVILTNEVLHRMELAGAEGIEEGLAIAREMIEECGPLAHGLYIMPSFGRYEMAAQLVSELVASARLQVASSEL